MGLLSPDLYFIFLVDRNRFETIYFFSYFWFSSTAHQRQIEVGASLVGYLISIRSIEKDFLAKKVLRDIFFFQFFVHLILRKSFFFYFTFLYFMKKQYNNFHKTFFIKHFQKNFIPFLFLETKQPLKKIPNFLPLKAIPIS